MWEFASVILVYNANPNTLLPASLWGLLSTLCTLVFSPALGKVLDHIPRLRSIGMLLCAQNLFVAFSAVILAVAISTNANPEVSPDATTTPIPHTLNGSAFLQSLYAPTTPTVTPTGELSATNSHGAPPLTILLLLTAGIAAAAAALASSATDTAMAKDWIVVLATTRAAAIAKERALDPAAAAVVQTSQLARVNAVMRASSLTCQILAPTAYAAVAVLISPVKAALAVAAWNVGSLFVEWRLRAFVYSSTAELQMRPCEAAPAGAALGVGDVAGVHGEAGGSPPPPLAHPTRTGSEMHQWAEEEFGVGALQDENEDGYTHHPNGGAHGAQGKHVNKEAHATHHSTPWSQTSKSKTSTSTPNLLRAWLANTQSAIAVYTSLPEVYCSLAYACLYPSVLNWGALMTAFLQWRGVSLVYVAVGRAAGAAAGVLGALAFAFGIKYASIRTLTLGSSALMIVSITPVVLLIAGTALDSLPALLGMAVALSVSRFFLWALDMALCQLIQESIPPTHRMTFGGVHTAVVNGFFLLSFLMVSVFHTPAAFGIPSVLSFVSVVAALPFAAHYLRVRKVQCTSGHVALEGELGGDGDGGCSEDGYDA